MPGHFVVNSGPILMPVLPPLRDLLYLTKLSANGGLRAAIALLFCQNLLPVLKPDFYGAQLTRASSFLLFLFSDRISCPPGWPRTCYVAEADLEHLPLPNAGLAGVCHHAQLYDRIKESSRSWTGARSWFRSGPRRSRCLFPWQISPSSVQVTVFRMALELI